MRGLNAGLDLLMVEEPGPLDRLLGRRTVRSAWVELLMPTALDRARKCAEQVRRARLRDIGRLYLTNRRVLLVPPSGQHRSLSLRQILGLRVLGEVMLLLRDSTRQYVVHPRAGAEVFPVLLARLLAGEG